MHLTDYHAKYFAHELTKRCSSDSMEKLAGAVAGAQVDLNPHQVDAALFAFNSPLSKGALLADEVGLDKTIEAGLVLSQKWAERKRRILIIVPSHLRKQWHQELTEKFFLPCRILETKSYNAAVRQGRFRPFEGEDTQKQRAEKQREITERNAKFFEVEVEKLDGWADDLKLGLEREIKEMDRQIKEARRAATIALTLEEKLAGQKQIKALESQRNEKRRSLFEAQDKVDQPREDLIINIEGKLTQQITSTKLFTIRWALR
jgi:hypothetical protein